MPNVLDSISPGFKALCAQLTAAGLNPVELLAGDSTALKTKLDSLKGNSSDIASAVEAATAELTTQLTEKTNVAAAFKAQLTAIDAAFAKTGIVLKASDEKVGLTAADIESAIKSRSSIAASEQLAKHGLEEPLAITPAADVTKPQAKTEPALKGFARVQAAFSADTAARAARN